MNNTLYRDKILPTFNTDYKYQIKKIECINLNLTKHNINNKSMFLANVERYKSTNTLVFTDASKSSNKAGYGIYIPEINYKFSSKLTNHLSICTAEIVAINEALSTLKNKNIKHGIIISDSLSAIQKLNKIGINPKNDYIFLSTKKLICDMNNSGFHIKLAWVPGHSKIEGNEVADKLAKIGRELNVAKNFKIDRQELFPLFKNKINSQHDKYWKSLGKKKGSWYFNIQPSFPNNRWFKSLEYIDRRHITTVIRMRTGHCLTSNHLYKIGIKDNPRCECGQIEDLDHIFFGCPINYLPNFDLYEKLQEIGFVTPINISTVLSFPNLKSIKILMFYLGYNQIKL